MPPAKRARSDEDEDYVDENNIDEHYVLDKTAGALAKQSTPRTTQTRYTLEEQQTLICFAYDIQKAIGKPLDWDLISQLLPVPRTGQATKQFFEKLKTTRKAARLPVFDISKLSDAQREKLAAAAVKPIRGLNVNRDQSSSTTNTVKKGHKSLLPPPTTSKSARRSNTTMTKNSGAGVSKPRANKAMARQETPKELVIIDDDVDVNAVTQDEPRASTALTFDAGDGTTAQLLNPETFTDAFLSWVLLNPEEKAKGAWYRLFNLDGSPRWDLKVQAFYGSSEWYRKMVNHFESLQYIIDANEPKEVDIMGNQYPFKPDPMFYSLNDYNQQQMYKLTQIANRAGVTIDNPTLQAFAKASGLLYNPADKNDAFPMSREQHMIVNYMQYNDSEGSTPRVLTPSSTPGGSTTPAIPVAQMLPHGQSRGVAVGQGNSMQRSGPSNDHVNSSGYNNRYGAGGNILENPTDLLPGTSFGNLQLGASTQTIGGGAHNVFPFSAANNPWPGYGEQSGNMATSSGTMNLQQGHRGQTHDMATSSATSNVQQGRVRPTTFDIIPLKWDDPASDGIDSRTTASTDANGAMEFEIAAPFGEGYCRLPAHLARKLKRKHNAPLTQIDRLAGTGDGGTTPTVHFGDTTRTNMDGWNQSQEANIAQAGPSTAATTHGAIPNIFAATSPNLLNLNIQAPRLGPLRDGLPLPSPLALTAPVQMPAEVRVQTMAEVESALTLDDNAVQMDIAGLFSGHGTTNAPVATTA